MKIDRTTKDVMSKTDGQYHQLFRDLRKNIAPLEKINPLYGLSRVLILGGICFYLIHQIWTLPDLFIFIVDTFCLAIFYAFLLVCTHDAIHHTLTGWIWFDETIARVISYPTLWAVGTYSKLHFLHHGWNGININDPERVQLTESEYQKIPIARELYFQNQWLIDVFIFGSIGLISKIFYHGWQRQKDHPHLLRQLILDTTAMIMLHSILITWVIANNLLWHYLLFWLIIERVTGVILQTRDHLEHYGKWKTDIKGVQQLTQLYTTRNLNVHPIVSWLMGGLDYHATHHAFPQIPFYHLAQTHQIVQQNLQKYGLPLMEVEESYIVTALQSSKKPRLIV